MTDFSPFLFCPYDGTRLTPRHAEGVSRPTCPACDFVDYANPKPCVAVLIEQAGKLLLGKRAVEPAKGMWDILGGFIDAGETAENAVHREIKEETGLDVTITRYLGSFPDTYGPRRVPTLNLGYLAVPSGGRLQAASDVAELAWLSELPTTWAFPHQEQIIAAWRKSLTQEGHHGT
jgi:NADH pyrophosphatase NudC (nudix superfamily)